MRPAGRQAAFGEDQHQRAEPQSLRQPGVVKPHANPRLTQGQAETEEDEQARQADPMSEPGRHDRREHHPGSGEQDKAEITRRHGRLRICRPNARRWWPPVCPISDQQQMTSAGRRRTGIIV